MYSGGRWLFLLGLLGVARAALGLAERADGRVAVDLLVARQARLHRRRLLPAHTHTQHVLLTTYVYLCPPHTMLCTKFIKISSVVCVKDL